MGIDKKNLALYGDAISKALFRTFTDPIVLVTILAPNLIVSTMKALHDASISSGHSTEDLFQHAAFPGVLDYVVQYYTTFIAFFLCIVKSCVVVVVPLLQGTSANKMPVPYAKSRWDISFGSMHLYGFIAIIIFIYGFILFTGNGSLNLLDIYIKHIEELGDRKLPPFASNITWLRGLVCLLGAWLALASKSSKTE